MKTLKVFVQGKFMTFQEFNWSTSNSGLSSPSAMCFVHLPHCYSSQMLSTSNEFKLAVRQVVASAVTQAAKLNLLQRVELESTQQLASTCNAVFWYKTSWSQTW